MAGFPTIYVTESLAYGMTIESAVITVQYSGTIQFYLTADGGSNWEEVTLTTNTATSHTFSTQGTDLRFMAVGNTGAEIAPVNASDGERDKPAIKIVYTEA